MKPYPTFKHELSYWQNNTYVIGLDEVGRGCLAGPVHVGGICLPLCDDTLQNKIQKLKIHDSKLCSAKKRESLVPQIKQIAKCWHVASQSAEEINKNGIIPCIEKAALEIILKITDQLSPTDTFIVFTDTLPLKSIYGKKTNHGTPIQQIAVPQADANTITVAAASIIAKVERDTVMKSLHNDFPHYAWNVNKGYATKTHREAIKSVGACEQHRNLYLRKLLAS